MDMVKLRGPGTTKRGALLLASTFLVSAVGATLAIAHDDGSATYDRDGHYSCRASAVRLAAGPGLFEPVVANDMDHPQELSFVDQEEGQTETAATGGEPCRDDRESAVDLPPGPEGGNGRSVNAKAVNAQTRVQPDDLGTTGHSHARPSHSDGARADSSVAEGDIRGIPNVIQGVENQSSDVGTLQVRADVVKSSVWTFCHCKYPDRTFTTQFASKSTVQGLTITEVGTDGVKRSLYPAVTTSSLRKIVLKHPSDSRNRLEVTLNADENGTQTVGDHTHRYRTRRAVLVRAFRAPEPDPSKPAEKVFEAAIAEATADFAGNPCEFSEVQPPSITQ